MKATGTVDNRATPDSLRRRHDWEAIVMNDLFPRSMSGRSVALRALTVARGRWVAIDNRFATSSRRNRTMTWETPGFVEVRMDAEMTAYADDLA